MAPAPGEPTFGPTTASARTISVEADKTLANVTIEVIEDRRALERHLGGWSALARSAAEPNVFHEPMFVLPVLETMGADARLRVAIVLWDSAPRDTDRLIGFFPLSQETRFRGLPFSHFTSWQHPLLYLGTPLLHRDHCLIVVRALLRWLRRAGAPGRLLEWPLLAADGPVKRAIDRAAQMEQAQIAVIDRFERALLKPPAQSAEAYIAGSTSAHARREWRRQRRRLAEQGACTVRALQSDEDARPWIRWFLAMEAAGWKGADGGALRCSRQLAATFEAICLAAHRHGKLHILGLFLDQRPVALQVNLLTSGCGFALKVAFDEAYAKHSPGALLEIDNIYDMMARPGFQWLDSCTRGHHPLMGRIWSETRIIEHLLIAPGRWDGRALATVYPLAQRAIHHCRRLR